MKISEVKLNEYDWMSIFRGVNDYGGAALTRGSGETAKGRLTQQIFIRDFMNDAVSGLESAIQSGLVNPDKSEVAVAQAGDFATPPPKMTQADVGDFDLKNKIAAQKAAQVQAAKDAEIANVGNTRLARAAASPTNPQVSAAVDARLQRADQLRKMQAANKTTESKYNRLNALFEAIINEDGTESIESWLTKFFTRHMRNVDLTGREQAIQAKAKEVATAIKQNKNNIRSPNVIKAIQSMGNLGYSLALANTGQAQQRVSPTTTAAAPAAATSAVQNVATAKQQVQTPAPVKSNLPDVEAALTSLGYASNDIKSVLPQLDPSASAQVSIVKALQLIKPTPGKTTKRKVTKSKNPDTIAGNILKDIDALKNVSPEKYKEVLQTAANLHSQVSKSDAERDDLAAARLARQQAAAKVK